MRSNRLSSVIFAGLLGAATTAWADTRAMPPDPYDPNSLQSAVPTQPSAMPRQQAANAAAWYSSQFQGPTDYPAAEINAIPVAKAQETVARAVYDRTRTSLYRTVDNLYEDFEYSPQFRRRC